MSTTATTTNTMNIIQTQGALVTRPMASILLSIYRRPHVGRPCADLRALERAGLIVFGWTGGGRTGHTTTAEGNRAVVDCVRQGLCS